MFGAIVPGRNCLTNFQRVSNGKFLLGVNNSNRFTQILIFKLPGTAAFPKDHGMAIYLSDRPNNFMYISFLSNFKQSVLIDIPPTFEKNNNSGIPLFHMNNNNNNNEKKKNENLLFLGLNLEKRIVLENLETKQEKIKIAFKNQMQDLANYIGKSLINYISSFSKFFPPANKDMIIMDLSPLQKWFKKFQNKLKMDPYFWKGKSSKIM